MCKMVEVGRWAVGGGRSLSGRALTTCRGIGHP